LFLECKLYNGEASESATRQPLTIFQSLALVAAITIKQAVATVLEDGSWLQRTNDSVQEFRKQNEKWTTVTAGMSYFSSACLYSVSDEIDQYKRVLEVHKVPGAGRPHGRRSALRISCLGLRFWKNPRCPNRLRPQHASTLTPPRDGPQNAPEL
jgi:hypothetical protein